MRTQQKSLTTEARPEGMIPMIAPTTTRKAVADRMEVEADHRGGAQGVGEARRVMEMKSLTRRSCKGAAGR